MQHQTTDYLHKMEALMQHQTTDYLHKMEALMQHQTTDYLHKMEAQAPRNFPLILTDLLTAGEVPSPSHQLLVSRTIVCIWGRE